jgi:osmotically-inducible protein OsmY
VIDSKFNLACKLVLVAALSAGLESCAPLIVGGVVAGAGMVAVDRRTTGTQVEDEGIEIKAASRIRDLATLGHVDVVSFNRTVLITGEVPGEAEKSAVAKVVAGIDSVRAVVNELSVQPNSSIGSRAQDALLVTKVKATLLEAKDVQASAFKVVSERGYVYLMGRVTQREADRGAALAAAVTGVLKVVRVFDLLTEAELARLGPPVAPAGPGAASAAGPASAPVSDTAASAPPAK